MAVKLYFRQVPLSWAVSTKVSSAFKRVAIVASNRQAMFFGCHGLSTARLFKLLAFQTSSRWVLTTQSRGPPYEHCIQIFTRRVGPLFWLLGGIGKKQNKVSSSRFVSAILRLAFLVTSSLPARVAFGNFSVTPGFMRRLSRFVEPG